MINSSLFHPIPGGPRGPETPGTRPGRRFRPAGHLGGGDRGAGAAADLPPQRTAGAAAAAAAASADPAAEPHCGAAGDTAIACRVKGSFG